jgi:hypothetical protein
MMHEGEWIKRRRGSEAEWRWVGSKAVAEIPASATAWIHDDDHTALKTAFLADQRSRICIYL